jgi:hypothetical protein
MKKYIQKSINLITIIAPVALLFFPKDYFDHGKFSVCLSKSLAGIECYACGLTRAVMHFIHLDFEAAWMFNKISFIVVPMLGLMWIKAIFDIQGKKFPGKLGELMYSNDDIKKPKE